MEHESIYDARWVPLQPGMRDMYSLLDGAGQPRKSNHALLHATAPVPTPEAHRGTSVEFKEQHQIPDTVEERLHAQISDVPFGMKQLKMTNIMLPELKTKAVKTTRNNMKGSLKRSESSARFGSSKVNLMLKQRLFKHQSPSKDREISMPTIVSPSNEQTRYFNRQKRSL